MTFNARFSHDAYNTLFNPLALIKAEMIPCLFVCMEVKCRNNKNKQTFYKDPPGDFFSLWFF